MRRLSCLKKINTNKKIIKKYIEYNIFSFFQKKIRKNFINQYRNFLKNKNLTQDWFSQNTYDWKKVLANIENNNFDYLEIGSFEGNSAMFVLNFYPNARLNCVDSWDQFTDGNESFDIKNVEKKFDENLNSYKERYKKYKMKSEVFFLSNNEKFDIIYVDGSHLAKTVMLDCLESWKILKKNGVLIMDDYFWIGYENLKDNPAYAINEFLKIINNEYLILRVSKHQIFIQKK